MVLSVVKYAVIGYAAVKTVKFVARKVGEWRGNGETTSREV